MNRLRMMRWLSTGLVLGSIGCTGGDTTKDPATMGPDNNSPHGDPPDTPPVSTVTPGKPVIPAATVLASLSPALGCDDLLTRVQDDAIAKLMIQVEQLKKQGLTDPSYPSGSPTTPGVVRDAGVAVFADAGSKAPSTDNATAAPPLSSGTGSNESGGATGDKPTDPSVPVADPVGASQTNNQVTGVDEADFVKLVDKGKFLYLLHGNTLRKLASWPAASTKLVGQPLTIEGSPSEMFVTDAGKAVVFSSVYSYASTQGKPVADCYPGYCGGYYGSMGLKITVADVSTDAPKVEREIYYEGSYLSSRRYGDVVRAVIQSYSKFSGLFSPQVQYYDAWGRPYDQDAIEEQLDAWQERTADSIRNTELRDWFPVAQQVVNGQLEDVEPGCDSYYVPDPGLTDYGLTHVLSLDTARADSSLGGVTIVGATSTVYSNATQLVLAQPDYRWNAGSDWGILSGQQTAYHVFGLDGASTRYSASGWLFGALPQNNAQFGIDVGANGTLRVATTGWVRDNPQADPNSEKFWSQHSENRVLVAKIAGGKVTLAGQSEALGKKDETVQSARFVGDRAYVVTYRQIDPLIVLDVAGDTPKVLGELEIPGFSQYMHPLDADHLITVGQSGKGGLQLQLFDVSNPANLPAPKTLDFGLYSSSEVSYNHKAFTSFEDLLAMPLYGQYYTANRYGYASTLEVIRVNAASGFTSVASIDHGPLYADNGVGVRCGVCEAPIAGFGTSCYDYYCGYQPELRRGHFVKGEDGKVYVYSISWAGVMVHALAPLAPLASVGLPQPVFDSSPPWYGGGVTDGGSIAPAGDAGVAPVTYDASVRDAGATVAVDAGIAPQP